MPRFPIRFDQPVDYLPDNLRGRRMGITELLVSAPTLLHAQAHAIRVTRGPGTVVTEVEQAVPLPPPVEVSPA